MNNPIPQCAPDSPEWAFRAVEMINELQHRIEYLEEALRQIRDYSAYLHPDEHIVATRDAALKESNGCTACQYAKKVKWPPSGLCDKHYDIVTRLEDKISRMYDYKQKWEPVEIARKALEKK